MRTRLTEFMAQLKYLPQTLQLLWAASRGLTLLWIGMLAVLGLLPGVFVSLTRDVVDGLVVILAGSPSPEEVRALVVTLSGLAAVVLGTELVSSFVGWIHTAQSELIQDHVSGLIHTQSARLDLAFYETPEYHDHLHRVQSEAASRSLALLESGGSLLQNSLTLGAMAAILLPFGLWLPVLLVLSTLPAFYILLKYNLHFHEWWHRTTPDRRWSQYYSTMLTNITVAPELRLFELAGHFQSAFEELRTRLRTERVQLSRDQSLAQLSASFLALLVTGGAMAWMVVRTLQGMASLGDVVLFYQAFSRGQGLMRTLLGSLGSIYSNTLFLGSLFEFLGLAPKIVDPDAPLEPPAAVRQGISFEGVTFRYPGSAVDVLESFDFAIPAGSISAIVGSNGAGKSTLVKLICRLYDPQQGRLLIDGVDVRQLQVTDLHALITVMFQVPVTYHATAGQNIALGSLGSDPGREEIVAAARYAGADELIRKLPSGYDTLLGKLFADGSELSVGEWQRIALARAFLRSAPIILLDEPTSFMDSWTETTWMKRFRNLARTRTAVVITHRFTTAMHANQIFVMDQGKIVEAGTHDHLLSLGGLYASSWIAQMETSHAHSVPDPDYPLPS